MNKSKVESILDRSNEKSLNQEGTTLDTHGLLPVLYRTIYVSYLVVSVLHHNVLEQGCFTNHLLSFDNNKVLKIINWIC